MFSHQHLNRTNVETRLVRFAKPPDEHTNIVLELCHVPLDSTATRYAALSYVEDENADTRAIRINDQPFSIQRSLHDALRQLQQDGVTSWLWVGPISVDQSDVEEKNGQATLMRTIFSRADLVYMWLGLGSTDGDRAMEFITHWGTRALAVGIPEQKYKQIEKMGDYIQKRVEGLQGSDVEDHVEYPETYSFFFDLVRDEMLWTPSGPVQRGVKSLLLKNYWHCVWIIQEVALAKEALVVCGEKTVSLDVFDATLRATEYARSLSWQCPVPEYRNLPLDLPLHLWSKGKAITTRRRRLRQESVPLAGILVERARTGHPYYTATDPRDIVFALLGVITDGDELNLTVDYNESFIRVFAAVTRALIHQGDRGSDRYHLHCLVPRAENPDGLPSWVPDWREVGKSGMHPSFRRRGRDMPGLLMSLDRDPDDCSENPLLLYRPGCSVAVITDVLHLPPSVDADTMLASIFEFAGLTESTGPGEDYVWRTVMQGRWDRYAPSEEIAQLWRKLMRRKHLDPNELSSEQVRYIREWPGSVGFLGTKPSTLHEEIGDIVRAFQQDWKQEFLPRISTMFKTNKGMLGLGYEVVRPGDLVTLLWGVPVPVILRSQEGEGSGEKFAYMGGSYVDGMMTGEFLKTNPRQSKFCIC